MSGAPATVSLRPVSMLVRFDGDNPIDMIVTYAVGVVIKQQASTLGSPAKTRLSFDPAEDAEMASLMGQLTERITARLNEQAGLVEPTLRLVDSDADVDDEEL